MWAVCRPTKGKDWKLQQTFTHPNMGSKVRNSETAKGREERSCRSAKEQNW